MARAPKIWKTAVMTVETIPLIIGMSPSPAKQLGHRAFHPGAKTTRNIARAIRENPMRVEDLPRFFDLVNLDILRFNSRGKPDLHEEEAKVTLQALERTGQLEERVVVLLGEKVCQAFAKYFNIPDPRRPSVEQHVHPEGWTYTVVGIDHASFRCKNGDKRSEHEQFLEESLKIGTNPTRRVLRELHEIELAEIRQISEHNSAAVASSDDVELYEDMVEQSELEWKTLAEWYSTPTYSPEDYE